MKGPGSQELAKRVLRFLQEYHLLSERQRLLIAVSGGPDSVCLLHILVQLQEELNLSLQVVHLDHQLRGEESEADAGYVADLARKLGVSAVIGRRDVKTYQTRQHLSLEAAAREVRYTFFAEVAESMGTDLVTVGHTTNDHVETILMHLIRGTGSRGLRGLQPSSRWQSSGRSLTVIRPLLEVSRPETLAYCHHHHLMPRIDTSNLSLSPLRNRIRCQLLPLLESYNPRVAEALIRVARIAGDDLNFLDKESACLWSKVAQRQGDNVILDKEGFLKLPSALQRHLLRTAIEKLLGSLKDIETRHIEEIMAALTKPSGKRLSLPGRLVFTIEYHRYLLGVDLAALCPFPVIESEFVLRIPGETLFPGWHVTATLLPPEPVIEADSFTAYLDFDKVGGSVAVRSRRAGDRFQPLGMSQPKKLGEFMVDAKVPRAWRTRVPVVCSRQHILWVVGRRIDDRVKITEDTRHILRLEFRRATDILS